MCKNFVQDAKVATSFNTDKSYRIIGTITCCTKYIIYQIIDVICGIDYVGYCIWIKNRWSNHKSHIKKCIKSCELSTHIINTPNKHKLDKSDQKRYSEDLKTQLKVVFLEKVDICDDWDDDKILTVLESREYFWQCRLKTTVKLGGINKRVTKMSKK